MDFSCSVMAERSDGHRRRIRLAGSRRSRSASLRDYSPMSGSIIARCAIKFRGRDDGCDLSEEELPLDSRPTVCAMIYQEPMASLNSA